ncbi:MAG: hypothetical protein RO009_10355 [Pseudorhodoplanes sp.]|nr:hypothetical protein [Pseudorhodoplanes sp.]
MIHLKFIYSYRRVAQLQQIDRLFSIKLALKPDVGTSGQSFCELFKRRTIDQPNTAASFHLDQSTLGELAERARDRFGCDTEIVGDVRSGYLQQDVHAVGCRCSRMHLKKECCKTCLRTALPNRQGKIIGANQIRRDRLEQLGRKTGFLAGYGFEFRLWHGAQFSRRHRLGAEQIFRIRPEPDEVPGKCKANDLSPPIPEALVEPHDAFPDPMHMGLDVVLKKSVLMTVQPAGMAVQADTALALA